MAAKSKPADQPTAEQADEMFESDRNTVTFSDTELRGIGSFAEALALVETKYGDVIDASSEIGSGFVILEDKDALLNVPFVILSYAFPEGDRVDAHGIARHYSLMRVVTKHNEHFVVTDGGTGIYEQLDEYYVRSGRKGGLLVERGLRKSEYVYTDPTTGEVSPATTYYLNV